MNQHPLCLGQGKVWNTLSAMRPGDLYWLLSDNHENLSQAARETIKTLPTDSAAAFIGFGSEPSVFLAGIFGAKIKSMPLFSLPYRKAALFELTDDLSRAHAKQFSYLIMHIPTSDIWQKLTSSQLNEWLSMLKKWVSQHQCTLLILQQTSTTDELQKRLGANYDQIGGLSRFYRTLGNLQWMVDWWRTPEILIHNQTFDIHAKKLMWQLKGNTDYDSFNNQFNDENDFLITKSVLEGSPRLNQHWQICDDNQALVNFAKQRKASTLVFALSKIDRIEILARQVYLLRKRCGRQIKIVIRELINVSRFSDVELLLLCGANLVVPHDLAYSKFLLMMESVRGQSYTRPVPTDINYILTAANTIKENGFVDANFFVHKVEQRIQNKILLKDEKGVLLKIQPKSGLKPKQLVRACHISREGDIITIINGWVYIFLSTCGVGDQEEVIKSLFHTPLHEICQQWGAEYQDEMILSQLQSPSLKRDSEILEVPADEEIYLSDNENNLSSNLDKSYTPIAIDLLSNKQISGESDAD